MATQAEAIFNNAELSLAAYADLSDGAPSVNALQANEMSLSQANKFASEYTVRLTGKPMTPVKMKEN